MILHDISRLCPKGTVVDARFYEIAAGMGVLTSAIENFTHAAFGAMVRLVQRCANESDRQRYGWRESAPNEATDWQSLTLNWLISLAPRERDEVIQAHLKACLENRGWGWTRFVALDVPAHSMVPAVA